MIGSVMEAFCAWPSPILVSYTNRLCLIFGRKGSSRASDQYLELTRHVNQGFKFMLESAGLQDEPSKI